MTLSSSDAILALLTQFEHQYSVNTAEITSRIGQLSSFTTSERPTAINEIRKLLAEVEDLLGQMELSVWELDATCGDRQKYDLRVKSYRNDKKQLDAELNKAINRLRTESNREELMGMDDILGVDQQDKLIGNTERLERSSRKIQDSYRITVETEQVGAEVLSNLSQQREVLSKARDRMRDADADLSKSNKILIDMLQRVVQNRLILLIVAVILMISLMALVYNVL